VEVETGSYETLVTSYKTTRRHVSEDGSPHIYHSEQSGVAVTLWTCNTETPCSKLGRNTEYPDWSI